jgi:hypothetical protein
MNLCYNLDGSVSQILTPNTISAAGCGPDLNTAQEAAKFSIMTQMCLTTPQQHTPGCCTYKFN